MKYEIKEKTSSKITIEVKHSKEEIEEAKKKAYSKLITKVKVPGFRQGKAPYDIGINAIGEGRLLEESLDFLIDNTISTVFDSEKIYPIAYPDVKVEEITEELIRYTIEAEFLPEIKIDLQKKYEIKNEINVDEKEISEKLSEIQDSLTEVVPVDREVKEGDLVEVQYEKENGEVTPFTVIAGKDKVIGDFIEKVMNKKVEERFEVVTDNSKLIFKVNSIKERQVPEINDELAKSAGFENLKTLKDEIKKKIIENKKLQAEEKKGKEVLKIMVNELNVELPEKFIQREVDERLKEIQERQIKRGKNLEDLLKSEEKSIDEFKEEIKKVVENELKEDLIIRDIIKQKQITVSDEEVEKEFERIIVEEGLQDKKIALTEEIRKYIKQELLRSKALMNLKENAIIIFGGD